ncbi:MAG: DNA mismatch repair endonuclease MutL [Bacteroidales bacterium]|jgi:DNA mismatch repair protein MutL|nr:DNA mismatch repair endonuclease MutL [Bacteroidales bacterium]MDD4045480.1 DNA mismatch repair endonuclease MutL [Bacteroidales bacterium]MDD4582245.1 DNA mismatch repair endonuclease MutL [Bacteroidales bacterium]NLO41540.1 DNA mismatch repair endonuclease MutL [Bacteroidales bacterium]
MADIIHLLPDSVANQIAAGEVIQRPASVVKELMENAVDAQADSIELILKDSGKTLIKVNDNGLGMSDTDARLCFERHATSKITSVNDIFTLHTKGFRGEALASIAAIAQVELRTKKKDSEVGTQLLIEGSQCKEQSICQCEKGSSFAVKNLFFNVPARRNFLKSDNVEYNHILDEFLRIALVHPEINFSLFHNDKQEYKLGKSNLKQRIITIFGNSYKERLLPVFQESNLVNISGFIGKPECARKTRGEQYLFVNQRFIKHPYFHHAICSAMDELIPAKHFPTYFIYLEVDPSKIDINIHPTKTEVKFQEEKFIYSILLSSVKHSLGNFNLGSQQIDFDHVSPIDFSQIPLGGTPKNPFIATNPDYNPFSDKKQEAKPMYSPSPFPKKQQSEGAWTKIYESLKENLPQEADKEAIQQKIDTDDYEETEESIESVVFQIIHKYIVSRIKSGFMIIDQEAAQERILYEQYMHQLENKTMPVQKLLFPETLSFSPQDADTISHLLNDFLQLGFDIEAFGRNTFILNGLPSGLQTHNIQETMEQILETYKSNMLSLRLSRKNNLAHSLAKTLGVKKGQTLTHEEMQHIIQQLFSCQSPEISPSGKKICAIFSENEILQLFN